MEDDEEQVNTISMEEKSHSYVQSDQASTVTTTSSSSSTVVDVDNTSAPYQQLNRSTVNWKIENSGTIFPPSATIQTLKPAFNGKNPLF